VKRGLRLLWFSTGRQDAAMTGTMNAVTLLRQHGFAVEFEETDGGHTWENWRDYLVRFGGRLFPD
jgi:enterochelin esterase family protein